MKAKTVLLGTAAVALGLSAQMPGSKPDAVADRAYHANGLNVEGVGVCKITDQAVDCWNMDGEHSAGLTTAVLTYYAGPNSNDISFRLGSKNRFLVLSSPQNETIQLTTTDGSYLQTYGPASSGRDANRLTWARISVPPTEVSASILVDFYGISAGPPVDLPFVRGQKASMDGITVEVGSYAASKGAPYGYSGLMPERGRQWSVVIGYSNRAGNAPMPATFEAFDRDGRPIRYVDRNGHSISGMQYLEMMQKTERPGSGFNPTFIPTYGNAFLQSTGPNADGGLTLTTNIDPKDIGNLRVSVTKQWRVQLDGFPLDLKG